MNLLFVFYFVLWRFRPPRVIGSIGASSFNQTKISDQEKTSSRRLKVWNCPFQFKTCKLKSCVPGSPIQLSVLGSASHSTCKAQYINASWSKQEEGKNVN